MADFRNLFDGLAEWQKKTLMKASTRDEFIVYARAVGLALSDSDAGTAYDELSGAAISGQESRTEADGALSEIKKASALEKSGAVLIAADNLVCPECGCKELEYCGGEAFFAFYRCTSCGLVYKCDLFDIYTKSRGNI